MLRWELHLCKPFLLSGIFPCTDGAYGCVKVGAVFAANIYEKLGFDVVPPTEPRQDIIQAVTLKSPERLDRTCKGIQAAAPVDSYALIRAMDMPAIASWS